MIPVYNEAGYLDECLRAIAAQTVRPYEVIVVDNNSSDGSVAIAGRYPFVKILHEPRQGVVYARDRGFNYATGDIIGRIDADTVAASDWVAKLQAFFTANISAGAVTGSVFYRDVSFASFFSYVDLCFRRFLSVTMRGQMYLYASNMGIRTEVWRAVRGTVCHKNDMHEDMDLAAHIALAGADGVVFDADLRCAVSGRRITSRFGEFRHYVFMSPRTMTMHGISRARFMYLVSSVVVAFYWMLRMAYNRYNSHATGFSMKRNLLPLEPRVSPIVYDK